MATTTTTNEVKISVKLTADKKEKELSEFAFVGTADERIRRKEAAETIQKWWHYKNHLHNDIRNKLLKIIKEEQELQVIKFAHTCLIFNTLVIIVSWVITFHTEFRYELTWFVIPFSIYVIILIWARTLILELKLLRQYTYISIGVLYIFFIIVACIRQQLVDKRYGGYFWFINIITIPLFYYIAHVLTKFAKILQYTHQEDLNLLSTQLVGKLVSIVPVIAILSFETFSMAFNYPELHVQTCTYMPGATLPTDDKTSKDRQYTWMYGNCTNDIEIDGKLISKTEYYYPRIVVTGADMKLQASIEAEVPLKFHALYTMLQAVEPVILVLTSQILLRVCRLSVYDILNARTSILELGLAVVTLICLVMEVVLTTVEISPKFRGPEHFNTVCLLVSFVFYTPAMIFRFYAMGKLVDRGLKVVEIEERGEKNLSKYGSEIRLIHKRSSMMLSKHNDHHKTYYNQHHRKHMHMFNIV